MGSFSAVCCFWAYIGCPEVCRITNNCPVNPATLLAILALFPPAATRKAPGFPASSHSTFEGGSALCKICRVIYRMGHSHQVGNDRE